MKQALCTVAMSTVGLLCDHSTTTKRKVLHELHSGHCGILQIKEIAHSYFWWPGLEVAIEEKAKTCSACQKLRNLPQLAPLHLWNWPEEPWQRVHIDFAGLLENWMFLVVIDNSKWPEMAIIKCISSERTIEELLQLFWTATTAS